MADIDSYTKPQRLVSEKYPPPGNTDASKFYSNFLYKAAIVTVFLVIIPLFPSQAPEFISQTVFTRSWELLHLLFVGIAVSYGLFSRRNDETTEKETHSKFDNAQSYVSRFLQVSSVFDDEAEIPSGSDENKVQMWNNQYSRGEPMVVVAQEGSVLDEQRGTTSRLGEKPLLLPVRSLKSRVSDASSVGINDGESGFSGSLSRSNSKSGSRRFSNNSNKSRNGELGGVDPMDLEEKLEENVVLPSPIPWRSRSGRMEMEEQVDAPPTYTLPPSMEGLESRSLRSQSSRSSRPNSSSSSPNKLSPSPSTKKLSPSPPLSSESQSKKVEDMVRKKSFHKSSPPPPPPPPPPMSRKSPLINSSPRNGLSFEKDLRRSFIGEQKDLSRSGREDMLRSASSAKEAKSVAQFDGSSMGKSVRPARGGESYAAGGWNPREVVEDGMDGKAEKRSKEVNEATSMEKTGRKMAGFDQTSARTEKPIRESVPTMPKPVFSDFQKEEKKEFIDTVIVESDYDSENEVDDFDASSDIEGGDATPANDGGPDVDKKADEFIAKFREQIRLQRIASIKKSSGQINRNSAR
ncbi:hypothetical protein L1049_022966 [Liquidambar formosana]|uniref:Uncharacterized protein n=1 Tax=Liquidambar formosana TaxID=63359 RepID=A0AAP0RDU1_LIQFO